MEYTDPFTQVYMGLWNILWAHTDLASAVKDTETSRIKFVDESGQVDPKFKTWLDQSANADLPAVTLMSNNTLFGEFESANGQSVTKGFSIGLYVGTYNLNAHMNPLAWYIIQAMDRYSALLKETWDGQEFIKRITLATASEAIQSAGEMEQALPRGWVQVWDANVLLWFSHQTLRGETP